jgi:hypothetical protein
VLCIMCMYILQVQEWNGRIRIVAFSTEAGAVNEAQKVIRSAEPNTLPRSVEVTNEDGVELFRKDYWLH